MPDVDSTKSNGNGKVKLLIKFKFADNVAFGYVLET